MRRLVIGTRGSQLALWQSRHIAGRLRETAGGEVELKVIKTTGDRIQDRHPGMISAKGIFVKEIEEALLAREVDLAVHSAKDLPGELAPGLVLAAFPTREDPRDALVTRDGRGLGDLPAEAVLGTASLRRRAQLLALRADLRFTDMRGNVDTRLRKMEEGQVDGIVLALAGLRRLGLAADQAVPLPLDQCLPAPGQGVLGLECRNDDAEVQQALARLEEPAARHEVTAERTVLAQLDAGCLVPLAALARAADGRLELAGLVARPDGGKILKARESGPVDQAAALGRKVADGLKAQGAVELLAAARAESRAGSAGDA
jgi:hydroxymethylbilane synthase